MTDDRPFIFISYSHSDSQFASSLSARLRRAGIKHFIDTRSITWGEHIPDQVHSALERATHLIVLISPGSEKSSWVAYEIGYARGRRVTVVPYLLHPKMDVPGFISNIRYISDLKEEAAFIARLKRTVSPKVGNPAQTTDRTHGPTVEPSPEKQINSESKDERRAAVVTMSESGYQRYVPLIGNLLKTETDQGVRQNAINALGTIGGELAVTLLEELWHGSTPASSAREAAQHALQQLHAWGSSAPLLNPALADDLFMVLHTEVQDRDGKRSRTYEELADEIRGAIQADLFRAGLAATITVDRLTLSHFNLSWNITRLQQQWYFRINYSAEARDLALAEKLIRWSPSSAGHTTFTIRCPVEIVKIAHQAQKLGMTVDSLLNDRVKVSGPHWPGTPPMAIRNYHASVEMATTTGGVSVDLGHLPWLFDTRSWIGCLRLSIRVAKVLSQ